MNGKRLAAFFMLLFAFFVALAPASLANSAAPPSLTVIVNFPPADLEISIRFADGQVEPVWRQERTAWEGRYDFDYFMMDKPGRTFEGAKLVAVSGQKSFECTFPPAAYDDIYMLDMAGESLTAGQPPYRTVLLISLRVVLTLLIEGLVFFAFRYRKKASWIAFLIINLVTQGGLNLLLSGPQIDLAYRMLGLIFLEILVILAEMLAFPLALREHRKRRAVLYAVVANILSLALGGAMLFLLPT